HADAGILDTERDALVDTPLNLQPYLAAGRRELDRVGQQIDENLRQLGRISHHRRQRLYDLADELDLRPARHVLDDLGAELDDFLDFDLLFRKAEPLGIGAGDIENGGNNCQQATAAAAAYVGGV